MTGSARPDPAPMRRLLLLRHGRPAPGAVDDRLALDDDAKRNAQRHGARLARRSEVPALVLAAPLPPARLAAEKVAKAMGVAVAAIRLEPRLASESPGALRSFLAEQPADMASALVIGDRPLRGLGRLLSTPALELPPSSIAVLAMASWDAPPGDATLVEVVEPGDLPRRFPFPFPNGPERRRRPAYYYDQVAAIPIRRLPGDGGRAPRIEVLLVSSGARKHWGIPKGVVEPGFLLQDAARREAFEEAGVEGRLSPHPVGSYRFEKWGAEFDVATYLLEVEREVADSEWLEPHRDRAWLPVEEAAEKVRAPGLARIIASLRPR